MECRHTDLIEYFPAPPCLHMKKRETFSSYGTCGSINIEGECAEDYTTSADSIDDVRYFCQTVRRPANGEHQLFAMHPSLPLLSPNNFVDLLQEPCLMSSKRMHSKLRTAINMLRSARTRMNRQSMQWLVKDMWQQLKALIEDSADSKNEQRGRKLLDCLPVMGTVVTNVRSLAENSKDFLDKKLPRTSFNYTYNGGCASYLPFNNTALIDQCMGTLVLSSGPLLSDITFCPVSLTAQNELHVLSTNCTLPVTGRVYETCSSAVHDQYIVACRHGDQCTLFEIQQDDGDDDCPLIASLLTNHDWSKTETPTSISLSPYISSECLVATETGSVFLWSATSRPQEVYRETEGPKNWHGTHFGSHPRLVVLSDSASISLLDLRRPGGTVLDLCDISQPFLHHEERFSITRQHRSSPFYHFLATNCSLLMVDERCTKYPVLMWTHSLKSAPQYMDVTGAGLPDRDDDLLLVASQDLPETHCFQFRLNSSATPRRAPQAVGTHWRASVIEDCYQFAVREGRGIDSSMIVDRLRAPLAGMCAIPHKASSRDGISIIQVTSLGDTFCQNYEADICGRHSRRDKTCSAGFDSGSVAVSSESLDAVQRWLEKANSQLVEAVDARISNAGTSFDVDISVVAAEVCRPLPRPHSRCQLCQQSIVSRPQYIDSDHQACPVCRNTTVRATAVSRLKTCQRIAENSEEDESTEMLDIAADHPMSEQFEDQLRQVNAADFTDTESQILLKLWNDDLADLTELLRKRDEETYNLTGGQQLANEKENIAEGLSSEDENNSGLDAVDEIQDDGEFPDVSEIRVCPEMPVKRPRLI